MKPKLESVNVYDDKGNNNKRVYIYQLRVRQDIDNGTTEKCKTFKKRKRLYIYKLEGSGH